MQTQTSRNPALEKTETPGVYRKPNGRYVVFYRDRDRKQHRKTCATYAQAKAFKGRADAGDQSLGGTRVRFKAHALEWLDTFAGRTQRGFSEATRDAYRRDMTNHVLPFFETYYLGDVRPKDVRRFIASLQAADLRAPTIRKVMAPLRAMYATALEDGDVTINPTVGVRVMGDDDADAEAHARALDSAELGAFLAAVPDDWRLFFEFLAKTGLRIGEAVGLTCGNVVFGEKPHVRVREQIDTKGKRRKLKTKGSRRDVPLSAALARQLWPLVTGQPRDATVFRAERGGYVQRNNVRNRVMLPARRASGVDFPGFGFHTFRHTCASLLFANGKNLKQVSVWLGHADPAFTLKTYVHLLDAGLGDADFFDGAVKAQSTVIEQATPAAAEVA